MAPPSPPNVPLEKRPLDPFRRAVLRGLGVLLPPLLTIVIFLWVGNTVITYLLEPMERVAQFALLEYTADIHPESTPVTSIDTDADGEGDRYMIDGVPYQLTPDEKWIPESVYDTVRRQMGRSRMPNSARGIYRAYIDEQYLQREYVIPVFLGVFILVLYLLGKFLAAGVGRILWSQFERVIKSLPLVRNVYSSVKQVTDFMFSEPHLQATRVVAIEYPRRGIWSIAMVTGESMLDIAAAANEPVVSVLVPSSPMPFTGYTMTVRKSETIDLNLTMDQALQFVVSCGVVVPPNQMPPSTDTHNRLAASDSTNASPLIVRGTPDE